MSGPEKPTRPLTFQELPELRRKTEVNDLPRLIHTVRGIGYVLRDTPP